jgi:hypothetical protein
MLEGDPSAVNYIRWLSVEVGHLPKVFVGVNENFISTTVEGALAMVDDSVDLDAIQDVVAASGADILPVERDVWRAAHAVAQNWWRCFGCDYVLDALVYFYLIVTTISLLFQLLKEKVEEVPIDTPSGEYREIAVDVEVAKIASENLTTSEGQDATETVAGVTHDDAEQEERVDV